MKTLGDQAPRLCSHIALFVQTAMHFFCMESYGRQPTCEVSQNRQSAEIRE